ncbi:MAG: hypothetical protein IJ566_07460 [Cardiobacteriaceae bacterium]|nr:hypothetical protein [Cardiobacteriaceae bacterium]
MTVTTRFFAPLKMTIKAEHCCRHPERSEGSSIDFSPTAQNDGSFGGQRCHPTAQNDGRG